jgi:hypothetical protein
MRMVFRPIWNIALALALGSGAASLESHAATITGFAESKISLKLTTDDGGYVGGLQDGQSQNTTVYFPIEFNDYSYSPVNYGTTGWNWNATTSTVVPGLGANSTVTGSAATTFSNQISGETAMIGQSGRASGEIAQFSTPDTSTGINNMVESHFNYFHYVYADNSSAGTMALESGSEFRAGLSSNAGIGDNVRVMMSSGNYGDSAAFPFFDLDAEIADGSGDLGWVVGQPLSLRIASRGNLFMKFWDDGNGGLGSELEVWVDGGLVTSSNVTGSFVGVAGLPTVGAVADFTLDGLPTIAMAWNAPPAGPWTFQFDTGGHVGLYSNAAVPAPATLACLLMGAGMLLGSRARRRRVAMSA